MSTVALDIRGMTVKAARQCAKDRKKWRAVVHRWIIEWHAAIYSGILCLFEQPSNTLVAYLLKTGKMPLHYAVAVNCIVDANTGNQDIGA